MRISIFLYRSFFSLESKIFTRNTLKTLPHSPCLLSIRKFSRSTYSRLSLVGNIIRPSEASAWHQLNLSISALSNSAVSNFQNKQPHQFHMFRPTHNYQMSMFSLGQDIGNRSKSLSPLCFWPSFSSITNVNVPIKFFKSSFVNKKPNVFTSFNNSSFSNSFFQSRSNLYCSNLYNSCLYHTSSHMFSSRAPYIFPEIPTRDAAKRLVLQLGDSERQFLLLELHKFEDEKAKAQVRNDDNLPTISGKLLWRILLFNGVPFIGFGLLDNIIMILAGEYIDATLGAVLGISTMAAAALGNLVSDVAGVGSAGYVELMAAKLGVISPELTPVQALMWQTRWMVGLGRALGISIGCLLGMFPLFFFSGSDDESVNEKKQKHADAVKNEANVTPGSSSQGK